MVHLSRTLQPLYLSTRSTLLQPFYIVGSRVQRCAGCTLLSRELRRVGLVQAWTLPCLDRLGLVWSHQNGLLYKFSTTNCSLVWSHIIMINIPKGGLRSCKICHPHIQHIHRHSEVNIDSVSQGDTIWPLSYHYIDSSRSDGGQPKDDK